MSEIHNYKVVLVGGSGVGKSTYVERLLAGTFRTVYQPTVGVEVHTLKFHTNVGLVIFDVWDCSGQTKHSDLRDSYYMDSECAIIMFAVDSTLSYNEVSTWYRDINRVCGTLSTVICANKTDLPKHKIPMGSVTVHRHLSSEYHNTIDCYSMSAKNNHNFEKPFLNLARKLTGYPDLRFTEVPSISPVVVNLTPSIP